MKITELFKQGEFVVSAEVGPPKGFHIEEMVESAKKYLGGVDAINVTDCSPPSCASALWLSARR